MKEYRLDAIKWDSRDKDLNAIVSMGWKPIAISKVENFQHYLGSVVILFEREEKP